MGGYRATSSHATKTPNQTANTCHGGKGTRGTPCLRSVWREPTTPRDRYGLPRGACATPVCVRVTLVAAFLLLGCGGEEPPCPPARCDQGIGAGTAASAGGAGTGPDAYEALMEALRTYAGSPSAPVLANVLPVSLVPSAVGTPICESLCALGPRVVPQLEAMLAAGALTPQGEEVALGVLWSLRSLTSPNTSLLRQFIAERSTPAACDAILLLEAVSTRDDALWRLGLEIYKSHLQDVIGRCAVALIGRQGTAGAPAAAELWQSVVAEQPCEGGVVSDRGYVHIEVLLALAAVMPNTPGLQEKLLDAWRNCRSMEAMNAAVDLGSQACIPHLIEGLVDDEWLTRYYCAVKLAHLGDDACAAIEPLERAIEAATEDTVDFMANALANLGVRCGSTVLVVSFAIRTSKSENSWARRGACMVLGYYSELFPEARAAAEACREDPDPLVSDVLDLTRPAARK